MSSTQRTRRARRKIKIDISIKLSWRTRWLIQRMVWSEIGKRWLAFRVARLIFPLMRVVNWISPHVAKDVLGTFEGK